MNCNIEKVEANMKILGINFTQVGGEVGKGLG